ncbi:elongation factor G [Fodinicola acaciae]|uniref:elongation factor G n=1 Tax=Fodinicola acaciae TaxID=2681555 RepID=UPI0013D2750C|nr:TetM/TetW/TetO/TetS family tetracycline resistance ribosomal protection protein [Fodinicola acaciae]
MTSLNLGILAHVDAGKTSLTERLLYAAGVIDEVGSVDHGNTQTDSLALERQRGITIKSAVVSFRVGEVAVNLIDTPGHPDFIAEVERVLGVLDGAVLVVSAVEGVQAQTRVLMRTLKRLRIPTLLFVNKIDRRGARCAETFRSIAEKLDPAVVPMGTATGLGTPQAAFQPRLEPTPRLLEMLADNDDDFLAAYVNGTTLPDIRPTVADQSRRGLLHPVYFGSAITGTGVDALTAGITELLPAADGAVDAPVSASVFKVERGPAGEKIAYARMFAGTLNTRDRPRFGDTEEKVTGISVFDDGATVGRQAVCAGQIAKLRGLDGVRIGDTIGEQRAIAAYHFAPPTLETVVVPATPAQKGAMHAALSQLAEQDPLINLRQDDNRNEISVSLYGEVQKEVIQATLADEFGVDVEFRETTTIHIERPVGSGAAAEFIKKDANPFLATVGLRVDPAPVGGGVTFRLEVELGSMPYAFMKAVEETVYETLREGPHGWQVTDCVVTLTHSGYWARQSHAHATFDKSMSSTAGDFRNLTPLVLMSALLAAGTAVFEPMHRFRIDLPADTFGALLPALVRLGAVPGTPRTRGSQSTLDGLIPAAKVHRLQQQLPGLTRGEGVLESAFERYEPVRGPAPRRSRSDHDPLNRKEYLLRVMRRVRTS